MTVRRNDGHCTSLIGAQYWLGSHQRRIHLSSHDEPLSEVSGRPAEDSIVPCSRDGAVYQTVVNLAMSNSSSILHEIRERQVRGEAESARLGPRWIPSGIQRWNGLLHPHSLQLVDVIDAPGCSEYRHRSIQNRQRSLFSRAAERLYNRNEKLYSVHHNVRGIFRDAADDPIYKRALRYANVLQSRNENVQSDKGRLSADGHQPSRFSSWKSEPNTEALPSATVEKHAVQIQGRHPPAVRARFQDQRRLR